jgi:hypothetical protein
MMTGYMIQLNTIVGSIDNTTINLICILNNVVV